MTYTHAPEEIPGTKKRQRQRIDYRELLDDHDFAIFSRLRDLRNRLAKNEGLAPYLVFNNEQLAKMVQGKVTSKAALLAI